MPNAPRVVLADPGRLRAVERVLALDSGNDVALARISRLATALVGTPVSLVTIVTEDRQVFRGQTGLEEPWTEGTPLSHSFCQHVVADDAPLVVSDARTDSRLRDNLAIDDLGVTAYCGVPLRTPDGTVLGSFCVIDNDPREWTEEEVALVEDLAAIAANELEQRLREGADESVVLAHDMRAALRGLLGGFRTIASAHTLDLRDRARFVAIVERHASKLDGLLEQLLEGPAALAAHLVDIEVEVALQPVSAERAAGRVEVIGAEGVAVRAVPHVLQRLVGDLVDHVAMPGVAAVVEVTQSGGTVELSISAPVPSLAGAGRVPTVGERAPGRGMALSAARDLAQAMGGDALLQITPSGSPSFVVRLVAA